MKPYITKGVIVTEMIGYVILLLSFVAATVGVLTIDGEIPSHYDAAGNVDAYSGPGFLFIVPGIMVLVLLTFSLLMHRLPPDMWNVGRKVPQDRLVYVLHDCCYMLTSLGILFALESLVSTITMLCGVDWTLPILIVMILAMVLDFIVYSIVSSRHCRN